MSMDNESAERWIPGLIAIARAETDGSGAVQEAIAILTDAGFEPITPDPGALAERFQTGGEVAERVLGVVDIVEVEAPLRAARVLAGHGIAASPIHWLAYQWHIFSSRIPPRDDPGVVIPAADDADKQRTVIAVVDSGIVADEALPGWVSSSIIKDPEDEETLLTDDPASHGTFVVGLIRQSAPRYKVSIAKAGGLRQPERDDEGSRHRHVPDPTTEWHVTDALLRLIERHRHPEAGTIGVLNLSLGVAAADPSADFALVMLRAALDRFRTAFPKCVIFASAGNSNGTPPNYPAAFEDVRGVAAASDGGGQVVWTEDPIPKVTPADPRGWVSDVAPGCDLGGISGIQGGPTIRWSGSSFASAIAAAKWAASGSVEVVAGTGYWPSSAMSYADYPELI